MNWIKSYGKSLQEIRSKVHVKVVEIDEIHTYIGKKTTNGYGLQLIETGNNVLVSLLEIGAQQQGSSYIR